MATAMERMGAEHVRFHDNFNEVHERVQSMKKDYAPKELDAEVIRSTALDCYLSTSNVPKVTALGHYEVEKALGTFQQQEKKLDEIHKKTAELVDSLLGDRNTGGGDGHGAKVESVDEFDPDSN